MVGFAVFIAAIILACILLPIGFIWGVIEAFVNRGLKSGFNRISDYFFDIALSIDQLGNVTCKELFNDTLIKSSSEDLFGNPDETISSVLGKNKRTNKLTKSGKVLDWILNKLDKNHSIKSIEQEK